MANYLHSGNQELLLAADRPTIQQIADSLAGAGLQVVRLSALQQAAIQNALAAHDGNRTRAAQALGISVRTLQRQLKMMDQPAEPSADNSSDSPSETEAP